MELKASSRQLAGGAHRTFHVVGAERLCQPSGLHKLQRASSPRVLPSASGREPVARDPGATGMQELAARRPLVGRKELRKRATGRRQAAMFGVPYLLGARVYWVPGWLALSHPFR